MIREKWGFIKKFFVIILRKENFFYKSNRKFFKKSLTPSETLNKILRCNYFFLFYSKKGGRSIRNQFRLFFLGVCIKKKKIRAKMNKKNKFLNFQEKDIKKLLKITEWSIFNYRRLKKKKSYFDILESRYRWKMPDVFFTRSSPKLKKKKISTWSLLDLKIWGRGSFYNSEKEFYQVFNFEKRENIVQKNLGILNSRYESRYRRYIIKKVLSKATFDLDFVKEFLEVSLRTDFLSKKDLSFILNHLKELSPEKFDDFSDYNQSLDKPAKLYLQKKLKSSYPSEKKFKKANPSYFKFLEDTGSGIKKKESNKFKGNFVYTEGFERLYSKLDLNTFDNESKINSKKSPFVYSYENTYPRAQNYFNKNKNETYENLLGFVLYSFKKKKKSAILVFLKN